jgi:hypothetical protein
MTTYLHKNTLHTYPHTYLLYTQVSTQSQPTHLSTYLHMNSLLTYPHTYLLYTQVSTYPLVYLPT